VAEVERTLRERLERAGWEGRCDAIVLDPEIEAWVWSTSEHVADCLGWAGPPASLREWLVGMGLWEEGAEKPRRPKEAVEAVQRTSQKRRSPRLYGQLAARVSLRPCVDPAFLRFCNVLREWFPPS
jgi:hypothetical protein